jgi:hypothetical protein
MQYRSDLGFRVDEDPWALPLSHEARCLSEDLDGWRRVMDAVRSLPLKSLIVLLYGHVYATKCMADCLLVHAHVR